MAAQPLLGVLIVEDSPTDVLLTEEALAQNSRFRVRSCERLDEALRLLAEAHFDVVLLDLGLPDSQGLDTLRRLRRTTPHVAVVVLTGKDDEELAEQVLHEGAQDYLVKGKADAGQLGRAIRYALERNHFEDRLRKSEEHFRLLVEGVKDHAILMLDPAGTVLTWNSGVERILGYEAEEIIGQPYARFFQADDVAKGLPQQILREAASTGRYRVEGWRVRKDGSRYWSNGSITAVHDELGGLRGFALVTRDMTERKRVDDDLRASEEMFRSAFDSTNIPMVVTDIDNRFLRVNAAFTEMFGYAEEELLKLSMADITHPDDLQESLDRRKAILAGEGSHFQIEKRYLHKDGRLLWGRTNVALVRDASGEPRYYVGQLQDITERRQVEEDLRLRDRAIQAVTQGILITDTGRPDNPIIYASPGFERMTGYTAAEATGRNCRFLQGPDTDRDCGRTTPGGRAGGTPVYRRTPQLPQGRLALLERGVDLAGVRRRAEAHALRRRADRRDGPEAARRATAAGAEDGSHRAAGGRRGPRLQQPAHDHQRLQRDHPGATGGGRLAAGAGP